MIRFLDFLILSTLSSHAFVGPRLLDGRSSAMEHFIVPRKTALWRNEVHFFHDRRRESGSLSFRFFISLTQLPRRFEHKEIKVFLLSNLIHRACVSTDLRGLFSAAPLSLNPR